MRIFYFFLAFLTFQIALTQEIQGVVYDGETENPIESVSVYFDNTTIGTTTDAEGKFSLRLDPSIKSPLIISYLGYETIRLPEVKTGVLLKIYIAPNALQLDEVVINPDDDWTREEKLEEFRKEFLGESLNGKASSIENEDDIRLYYSKKDKQLKAVCKTPIVVINTNLRYKINVNLIEFEVNYSFVSKNKKRKTINFVYYTGNNYYESLEAIPSPNTQTLRDYAYKGSVLHFMRSLASERLNRNGYEILKGSFSVNPKRYIRVLPIEDSKAVYVRLKGLLNVSYRKKANSSIESYVTKFKIDAFGNHSPIDGVRFSGFFAKQRLGDALPLDYKPIN